MREILLSTPARKQYSNLEGEPKSRIKTALKDIAAGNEKRDVKKLKGLKGRKDLYRLRVGDYRVIYYEDAECIKVTQIIHRSKGYDWL
ncbi:MAG: type II toxin-antitoxin system RelE/ParE family toxin [Candidatus Thermoplasmatota archaeon]|nr:type II toxin-antitoxin system RelE/ParE family toxin [Candidatus Thermoplasmatota archaeon]